MDFMDIKMDVLKRYDDIVMSRTPFALRNFVLGMHGDLCPKTVYQLLLELKPIVEEMSRLYLEKEELGRNIVDWEGASKQTTIDQAGNIRFIYPDIEITKCKNKIDSIDRDLKGKQRELAWLYNVLKELPSYTVEDMMNDEPRYWGQRLLNQMIESWQANHTGFDRGDLISLRECTAQGFADDLDKLPYIVLPQNILADLIVKTIPVNNKKEIEGILQSLNEPNNP